MGMRAAQLESLGKLVWKSKEDLEGKTVFSKDGVFRFQGKMAYPQTFTLYLSPMTDERKIVVQAGNILVKAKAGDLEHAQIQGSSANDDMDF